MTEEELPSGWAWATLGEITNPPPAKVTSAERPELPFIGMDSIEPGSLGLAKIGQFAEMRSAASYFRPNDILYGRLRPYLNKVHRAHFEGAASAEFIVMPPSEAVTPDFLMYLLHSHTFVRFASLKTSGDRPRVDRSDVIQYRLGLPPANEQRRIVERIEELFSQIEAGEAALARAKRLLARYRQAVLKAAVTGELTRDWRERQQAEIEPATHLLAHILQARREAWEKAELEKLQAKGKPPKDDTWKKKHKDPEPPDTTDLPELPEGWVWASLDQLAWQSSYGTSAKCTAEGSGQLVLRIPNVRSARLVLDDLKYAETDLPLDDRELVEPGDMLVIRTNGSLDLIGHAVIVEEVDAHDPAYFASYLIRFRLLGNVTLWRWLMQCWRSERLRRPLVAKAATSAGQYNISLSKLAPVALPLPPFAELEQAVDIGEALLAEADALKAAVETEERRAAALRQAILTAAFAGKLIPQDPADEPAAAMIERIRSLPEAFEVELPPVSMSPRTTRKPRSTMPLDRKTIKPDHLRALLAERGKPLKPHDLWQASDLHIDDFYKQLRDEIAAGRIIEDRKRETLTAAE